jgi:hypothetical protein
MPPLRFVRQTHLAMLHGLGERERAIIAGRRHLFDQPAAVHAARRRDVEHARHLVVRLAHRVVQRVAQQFIVADSLNVTTEPLLGECASALLPIDA